MILWVIVLVGLIVIPVFVREGQRLMIVAYFNIFRVIVIPFETDAPCAVNADGMLAVAIAAEGFESVARRNAQIIDVCAGIQQA